MNDELTEQLKPLAELLIADPRHLSFVLLDRSAPGGLREPSVADYHAEVADLELSEAVPPGVRSAFAVVRMIWLFGWYYWPLHTIAGFQALLCLDIALGLRIQAVDGTWAPGMWRPSFTDVIERAVHERWITDDGISHARRLQDQRERYASRMEDVAGFDSLAPAARDDQRYSKLLAEVLPDTRNRSAHPANYWHSLPGDAFLTIENVRDIIAQLFPSESASR